MQEISHLIDQMTDEERRAYLVESLFLNAVKYENDRADAYMRKLSSSVIEAQCPGLMHDVPELSRHPVQLHAGRGARS